MPSPAAVFVFALIVALVSCDSKHDGWTTKGLLLEGRRLQQLVCEQHVGDLCIVSSSATTPATTGADITTAAGEGSSTFFRVGLTGDGSQGFIFLDSTGDPVDPAAAPVPGAPPPPRMPGGEGEEEPSGPRRVDIAGDVSELPFTPPWGGIGPFANAFGSGRVGLSNAEAVELFTGESLASMVSG
ncbi:hypothetical protein BSKO_13258 [Bryopsis sp. KO-2023]|nr:hypothetical protein BSKO_13258 [Bryopsis sp. KO-2023]